jgi:hypothetical protein
MSGVVALPGHAPKPKTGRSGSLWYVRLMRERIVAGVLAADAPGGDRPGHPRGAGGAATASP